MPNYYYKDVKRSPSNELLDEIADDVNKTVFRLRIDLKEETKLEDFETSWWFFFLRQQKNKIFKMARALIQYAKHKLFEME